MKALLKGDGHLQEILNAVFDRKLEDFMKMVAEGMWSFTRDSDIVFDQELINCSLLSH